MFFYLSFTGRLHSPTHEITAAVHSDHSTCSHVSDDSVVLNGEVATEAAPQGVGTGWYGRGALRSHLVALFLSDITLFTSGEKPS